VPSGASEPILIGVLYDFPQHDGGASVEEALRHGLATGAGRLDRSVELRPLQVQGLPAGSEEQVVDGFRALENAGVLAVVGPSISDNGVVVRDLADGARLPCINYTGGEITRSEWMFHYQVGSLTEEPVVMVEHVARVGHRRAAALYDDSIVGRNYIESFRAAADDHDVVVVHDAPVSAVADDLTSAVEAARVAEPDVLCYLGLGVASRAVALAVKGLGWSVPVVCNSSLMFGYTRKDWRPDWEGWVYVDTIADDNPVRRALKENSPKTAAGPVGVAAYDIGRLIAAGLARAPEQTRDGLRMGLERVKRMPASTGYPGTTMGFGVWDHGALKGGYLVLRQWRDSRTVQLEAP